MTGLNSKFLLGDISTTANRVIFFHKCITFGGTPIVLINCPERSKNRDYADITGAVRTLTDKYKLRVIVDGSPNALDASLFTTGRQEIIEIKQMSREMMESLPQLKELFQIVEQHNLGDVMWYVLGGNPMRYEQLFRSIVIQGRERQVVGELLSDLIKEARKTIGDAREIRDGDDMRQIIDQYVTCIMNGSQLNVEEIIGRRSNPDGIFRKISIGEKDQYLVPISNAMAIALKYGKIPTLEELEQWELRDVKAKSED